MPLMATARRDYDAVAARLSPHGSRHDRMQRVADALWDAFHEQGVSWVGFYLDQPDAPDDRRLVLGPHRDKPACSPLAMHGVCGQTVRFRTTRIIEDVSALGADYIACDPKDRSEIAIPLIDEKGECWGLLDLDSWEVGAFDEHDDRGLMRVLEAAGLRHG
jgi:putative methionine-R-sulfoxide reductase with GAF domain